MTPDDELVGEDRCWPCTVANGVVAVLVGGVPLLAGALRGDPILLGATAAWALVVVGYTTYRLVARGYLPGAEWVAKRTGLHERIGPGAGEDSSGTDDGVDDGEASGEEAPVDGIQRR